MSDKLEVSKERVLSAAAKCPVAADTLKELFPEAFKKERPTLPVPFVVGTTLGSCYIGVERAPSPELRGKCLLFDHEEWEVVQNPYCMMGGTYIVLAKKAR